MIPFGLEGESSDLCMVGEPKPKLIRTNYNNKWCVWSKVKPLIF